jgi:serine phosphatase RsbU (regulator of sigma subunit)
MSPKLYRAATGELTDAISLEDTGVPIGALPGYPFEQVTMPLEVGDSLAVFTDGVTDAMSTTGEMFGTERADAALTADDSALAADAQRPKRLGERLVAAVRAHAAGQQQNDDIAVVAFGRLEVGLGANTSASKVPTSRQLKLPG